MPLFQCAGNTLFSTLQQLLVVLYNGSKYSYQAKSYRRFLSDKEL